MFMVLFQVWLRDGQKATDVAFFKSKPLAEVARVGQKVTIAARSIVSTKGAGLKPSVLELQAIVVALKSDGFPQPVPRPTK